MGIQIIGNGGTVIGGGEEAALPMHAARFPFAGNWYRASAFTGTIGAALAASSEVFEFRFTSGTKSFALVTKVALEGIGIVAVGTAGGPMGFELVPARAWTVYATTGGTAIATTADNLQTETALANAQATLAIATTGAISGNTKTNDANAQGGVLWTQGTGAITTYQQIFTGFAGLYDADGEGQQPLVLANQEGFVVRTSHVGVAALTYVARFRVVWCEVTAF